MTREVSVAIRFKVNNEDAEHLCSYNNADAALADPGIKMLFDSELVETCVIERQGKRLAGLAFMTWERFENALEPYTSR